MQGQKIECNLLFTVDAAKGASSDGLNRKNSSNVITNINHFETNGRDEIFIPSHGDPNTSDAPGVVENYDESKEKYYNPETKSLGAINHYNIDDYTVDSALNSILKVLNSQNKKEAEKSREQKQDEEVNRQRAERNSIL